MSASSSKINNLDIFWQPAGRNHIKMQHIELHKLTVCDQLSKLMHHGTLRTINTKGSYDHPSVT
jgi:hypothetical protein